MRISTQFIQYNVGNGDNVARIKYHCVNYLNDKILYVTKIKVHILCGEFL